MRVGWAGDHINAVTRINQGLTQILQVDALATTKGLTAVAEQRDSQRSRARRLGLFADGRRCQSSGAGSRRGM